MAQTMENDFFYKKYQLLGKKLQDNDINLLGSFGQLLTDRERFSFVDEIEAVQKIFNVSEIQPSGKSCVISQLKRNEGNKYFKNGGYSQALNLYSQSVAAAPKYQEGQSEKHHLALGYSNRSAALLHLNYYQECLDDINSSLKAGYPKELQYKLVERKGKCFLELGQFSFAQEAFAEAKILVDSAKLDQKKKEGIISGLEANLKECREQKDRSSVEDSNEEKCVPTVADGAHSTFISLSSACDVTYTEHQGRFLVANRDIKPGEVVVVEKPYASVVLPDQYDGHCHHCFKPCIALTPCRRCPTALFCCTECRDNAWKTYHQYECDFLEMIHQSGVGKFGHLALRTVTASGAEFLAEFHASKSQITTSSPKELEGCNADGLYAPDNYDTIYHLVTHDQGRTAQDLFRRAVTAVFLVKCLHKSRFFTEALQADNKEELVAFVGGLILSHLQSFPCNAHEIAELELNKASVGTSVPREIGAGIYATLSLFNHSCDPTVNRNFYRDTCVVRAIKTIRKGEEVSDNYGAVYATLNKADRHKKLTPQYYFECGCEACVNDWPLYFDIEKDIPSFKCPSCRAPIKDKQMTQCPGCSSDVNMMDIHNLLSSSEDSFQEGFEKLLENDIENALPKLLKHIEELDRLVVLPWRDYNNCQEGVKQCFSIMGNCVNV